MTVDLGASSVTGASDASGIGHGGASSVSGHGGAGGTIPISTGPSGGSPKPPPYASIQCLPGGGTTIAVTVAVSGAGGGGPTWSCPTPQEAQWQFQGGCVQVYGYAPSSPGKCCYYVSAYPCTSGRPFIEEGIALTADIDDSEDAAAWAAGPHQGAPLDDLPRDVRHTLAAEWRRDGLLEHASIASFGRFALELLALGAPPSLVSDAHQAARDEVRHARACLELAARYDGTTAGPGSFPFDGPMSISSDLCDVAARAAIEGCVGETVAAVLAAEQLAEADDPEARRVLAMIARDEARHAELAWRAVSWAIDRGGAPVRRAVEDAFAMAFASDTAFAGAHQEPDASLARHGRLDARTMTLARRRAIDEVVEPCLEALLSSSPQSAHQSAA